MANMINNRVASAARTSITEGGGTSFRRKFTQSDLDAAKRKREEEERKRKEQAEKLKKLKELQESIRNRQEQIHGTKPNANRTQAQPNQSIFQKAGNMAQNQQAQRTQTMMDSWNDFLNKAVQAKKDAQAGQPAGWMQNAGKYAQQHQGQAQTMNTIRQNTLQDIREGLNTAGNIINLKQPKNQSGSMSIQDRNALLSSGESVPEGKTQNRKNFLQLGGTKLQTQGRNNRSAWDQFIQDVYKAQRTPEWKKAIAEEDEFGRYGKGTIDLLDRRVYKQKDGTYSTENSISFHDNETGKEILIPTIIDGQQVSDDEAIEYYYKTKEKDGKGEYLGMFDTPEEADEYAEKLHERGAWLLLPKEQYKADYDIDNQATYQNLKDEGKRANWYISDLLSGKLNGAEKDEFIRSTSVNAFLSQFMQTMNDMGKQDGTEGLESWQYSPEQNRTNAEKWQQTIDFMKAKLEDYTDHSFLTNPEGSQIDDAENEAMDLLGGNLDRLILEGISFYNEKGEWVTIGGDGGRNHQTIADYTQNEEAYNQAAFRALFGQAALDIELSKNGGHLSEEYTQQMEKVWDRVLYNPQDLMFTLHDYEARRDDALQQEEIQDNYFQIMQRAKDDQQIMKNAQTDYIPENANENVSLLFGSLADRVYRFIGGGMKDEIEITAERNAVSVDQVIGGALDGAGFLLPDEIEAFNAYYNDNNKAAAEQLLKDLEPSLKLRQRQWQEGNLQYFADQFPILATATSVVSNKLAGLAGIVDTVLTLTGAKTGNANDDMQYFARMTETLRNTLSDNVYNDVKNLTKNEFLAKLAQIADQTFFSVLDFTSDAAIGSMFAAMKGATTPQQIAQIGKVVSLGLMTTESYGSAYYDALKETNNPTYAALTAGVSALLELGTETILGTDDIFDYGEEGIRYWLGAIMGEAAEELEGSALEPGLQTLKDRIYGYFTKDGSGMNQWEKDAMEIAANDPAYHYTDENGVDMIDYGKAMKAAMQKWGEETLWSGIGGGLGGLGGGMIAAPQMHRQERDFGRKIRAAGAITEETYTEGSKAGQTKTNEDYLIDIAEGMKEGSRARDMAKEIRKDLQAGKKLSDAKLGRLASAISADTNRDVTKAMTQVMSNRVAEKLRGKEGSKIAQENADLIAKAVVEGIDTLSRAEQQQLAADPIAFDVYRGFVEGERTEQNAESQDFAKEVTAEAAEAGKNAGGTILDNIRAMTSDEYRKIRAAAKATRAILNGETKDAAQRAIGNSTNKLMDAGDGTGRTVTSESQVFAEGEEAEILGVTGDGYRVNVGGEEKIVPADEVKAGGKTMAATMSFIEMNKNVVTDRFANLMVQGVKSGAVNDQNIEEYLGDAFKIRIAAFTGRAMPESRLDPKMVQMLYDQSQADAAAADAQRTRPDKRIKVNPGNGAVRLMGVEMSDSAGWKTQLERLGDEARSQVEGLAQIFKKIGVDVSFINDPDNKNVYGSYDIANGSVIVNIAGENNNGTQHHLMVTASHELTHFLERNSPEAYRQLRDFVFQQTEQSGADLNNLIQKKIDQYNLQISDLNAKGESHELLTIDGAMAEVVADACDQMLGNEQVVNHLAETNKGLYAKIRDFVKNFIEKVKKGAAGMSRSGSRYSNMIADMDGLAKLWNLAFDEATTPIQRYEGRSTGATAPAEQIQEAASLAETELSFMDPNDTITYDGIDLSAYPSSGLTFRAISSYSEEEQNRIKGYLGAVDNKIVDYFVRVLKKDPSITSNLEVDTVPKKLTDDIKGKLNIDTTGWHVQILRTIVDHIDDRHRSNSIGSADQTMKDLNDIGRIMYVLNNYDNSSLEKRRSRAYRQYDPTTGKNIFAPVITVNMKIDGEYVAALAVPNTRSKVVGIVSLSAKDTNKIKAPAVVGGSNASVLYGPNPVAQNTSANNIAQASVKSNNTNTQNSFAEIDERYMDAVNSGDMDAAQKLVEQYAKDAGYTMKVYHGTPYGGFTKFHDWSYFTEDKEYAGVYQNNSASSIRGRYDEATKRMTYELFMKPGKVFDTRKKSIAREYNKARMEYGMTQLLENGLPDWTAGLDLVEYIEDNGLDYDTIILDEGGTGGYGEEVKKRGLSYVSRANAVKSAELVTYDDNGDIIPLSERFNEGNADIRWSLAEDMQEKKIRMNQLRDEIKGIKNSAEMNELMDDIMKDPGEENLNRYTEFLNRSGLTDKQREFDRLQKEIEEARKNWEEEYKRTELDKERKAIEKSGLSEDEWRVKQAIKEFGKTTNAREAGYMLPDGSMLNFSGEKGRHTGRRGQDHRGISTIFADPDLAGWKAMRAFMNGGNIRIMSEADGIDLSQVAEPTSKQYAKIRQLIREFMDRDGEFNVDFTDKDGNSIGSINYEESAKAERILNDIKYFYQTGEVREQSDIDRFRQWSMADMNTGAVDWMADLAADQKGSWAERGIIRQYRERMAAVTETRNRIQQMESDLVTAQGEAAQKLMINLQTENKKLARQTAQLNEITDSESWKSQARRAQKMMNQILKGNTQDEIDTQVQNLKKQTDALQKQATQAAEKAEKLGQDKDVAMLRSLFSKTSLNKAATDLKKTIRTGMTVGEIGNALAELTLRVISGDAGATQGIEALAGRMAQSVTDEGWTTPSYVTEALRGTTFTLTAEQWSEMKRAGYDKKTVRSLLAGTGIRFTEGNSAIMPIDTLVSDELAEMVPELRDLSNMSDKDMAIEIVEMLAKEKDNRTAARPEISQDEIADTMARIMDTVLDLRPVVEVNDPGIKTVIRNMTDYITEISGNAEKLKEQIREIGKKAEETGTQGRKISGAASVLNRDTAEALDTIRAMSSAAANGNRAEVERLHRRLDKAIEYYRTKLQQAQATANAADLEQLRETLASDATKRVIAEREKWQRAIEKDREMRAIVQDRKKIRKQIERIYNRMSGLLTDETDKKAIPEEYKSLARAALKPILGNELSGGKRITEREFKRLEREKRIHDLLDSREGTDVNLNAIEDEDIRDTISEALTEIKEGIEDFKAAKGRRMDALEADRAALKRMQKGLNTVYEYIKAQQTVSINGREILVADLADEVDMAAKERDIHAERVGALGEKMNLAERKIYYGNMTPEYFFKSLNNRGMNTIWEAFHEGENKNGLLTQHFKERIAGIAEENGYGSWDMTRKIPLELKTGETVNLTPEQMMSLYATYKREQKLCADMGDKNTSHHLRTGGFVLEEKAGQMLYGKEAQRKVSHKFTAEDFQTLESLMDEGWKRYADAMVELMSTEGSRLGNEASMRMYGIKKYNETYYFPFSVWDGVKNKSSNSGSSINPTNNNRAAYQGFTYRLKAKAGNAVMIRDFTQACVEHMNQMVIHNTMGTAVETMNKVLNFRVAEENGSGNFGDFTQRNIEVVLEERYGKNAVKYIRDLLQDLNGGVTQDRRGSMVESLMSVFKKNAVGGSLSVALQQPLSYIRAATMISPKYLTKALSPNYYKGSYTEMMAHSGLAVIKAMGRFDMNYGQSAREYLTPEQAKKKGQAVYDQIVDKANILPELMDKATWARMWSACKLEQAALNPGMEVSSDAFLEKVGERFNEVMRRTQVYDSVLVKSSNMRSTNWTARVITAFKAEPTLTANMLMDAWRNRKTSGGKKAMGAALATYLLSAIMQAVFKAGVGAGRTPDEKKTWAENFANKFAYNFIGEANPISLIPGYSEIVDALSGNDIKDNAYGVISNIYDSLTATRDIFQGKGQGAWKDIENTAGQITQIVSGIPLKNLMRDSRAIYNWALGSYADRPKTTEDENGNKVTIPGRATSWNVIGYQTRDTIISNDLIGAINKMLGDAGYSTSNTAYYDRIYAAEKAGRKDEADAMREYLQLGKGVTEKALKSGVASVAKKDPNATAEDTAAFLLDGGYTDRTNFLTEQYKAGELTDDQFGKLYEKYFPDKSADDKLLELKRSAWRDGDISDKELEDAYSTYGKTEQDYLNYIWDSKKDLYKEGKLSKAELEDLWKKKNPDKDKTEMWFVFDKIDWEKETGKKSSNEFYYRIHDAIESNKSDSISKAIKSVMDHGKTKNQIAGSIKGTWSDDYLKLKDGSAEKVKLKDALIKAYKAIGYSEQQAANIINKWKKK